MKDLIVHGGGLCIFLCYSKERYFLIWESCGKGGRYDGEYLTRAEAERAAYRFVQY